MLPTDLGRVAARLKRPLAQVEAVVALLDAGNTVPFITRYRKDQTGGLDEEQIRAVQAAVATARQLDERKRTILRSIQSQGLLTPELAAAIEAADAARRLEDLYLPFKPKKQSRATLARQRGLEPLADAIYVAQAAPSTDESAAAVALEHLAAPYVSPEREVPGASDALEGARHILAERFSEHAEVRGRLRSRMRAGGRLVASEAETPAETTPQGGKPRPAGQFRDYFNYSESLRRVPPHRVLAINRGERARALRVRIEFDTAALETVARELLFSPAHPYREFLEACLRDALSRLVLPSLERELRRELTEKAESHAFEVFARNLRTLLLTPPVRGRRVLAVDPGLRSGCKLAALDEFGNLLDQAVVHVVGPEVRLDAARQTMRELIDRHHLGLVAIGNGTGSRQAQELVSELIAGAATEPAASDSAQTETVPAERSHAETAHAETAHAETGLPEEAHMEAAHAETAHTETAHTETAHTETAHTETALTETSRTEAAHTEAAHTATAHPGEPPQPPLAYVVVNEAGASVYSTSALGREEFPQFDATLRGTISIGRRLQDPLSELVKIDPANIGVGLYQHDLKGRQLRETLDAVVESCVNYVGVDLNTASPALLQYVSGLNQLTARRLYEYRQEHGPFRRREEIKHVPGIGQAAYTQAAGFLKIIGGDDPLDATWIHPESYTAALRVLERLECRREDLTDRQAVSQLAHRAQALATEVLADELDVGALTLTDILANLARPGRDPREDLPPPLFKQGILKLDDLRVGMELTGTVLNVVDFGAFVDVGIHDTGLVHVSQLSTTFVRNPHDVVEVGDVVRVWVLAIDRPRRRVSLTMIDPASATPDQATRGQRQRGRPAAAAAAQGETAAPAATGGGSRSASRAVDRPATTGPRPHGKRSVGPRKRQRPRRGEAESPAVKLTEAMCDGREPLRSFAALKQLYQQKQQPPPADG